MTESRRQPIRITLRAVKYAAFLGRWFAGASSVGVVMSISVMFSSYTSLTTIDPKYLCVGSHFISSTMQEAHNAATEFVRAGVLALITAAAPRAIWFGRNEIGPPIPFRNWAEGFSNSKVTWILILCQVIPMWFAASSFLNGTSHAFNLQPSPESIQLMWHGFETKCPQKIDAPSDRR